MGNCDPTSISPFRGRQLNRLQTLVAASASTERIWEAGSPPDISPVGGKLKIAAFASLMYQANLGGSEWGTQFVYGFP